jgi:CHAT domain-containing protein
VIARIAPRARWRHAALAAAALAQALALPVQAKAGPGDAPGLAGEDSFRIGNAGVACTATRRSEDPRYASMFDRGYLVVCRDAASPVATLYVLEGENRSAEPGSGGAPCQPLPPAEPALLPGATRTVCHDAAAGLDRVTYRLVRQGQSYIASGLAAYDSAIRLGLAALLADRPMPGMITVAVTGSDDPAALARAQAERFDPAQALAAGMARANDGDHADATEFFDRLAARARAGESGADRPALYLAGQAIEQSMLGNRAQAATLFARASTAGTGNDPVFARLYRNLLAMHRLDGGDVAGALATLDAPLPRLGDDAAFADDRLAGGFIDHPLAQRLSLDDVRRSHLGSDADPLSDGERAQLLDAQAVYLRGEAHRLIGKPDLAHRELRAAIDQFGTVRGGRVLSMAWLPADVFTAEAALAESEGHADQAASLLQQAVDVMAALSPDSAAWLGARARQAGFRLRHDQVGAALETYAELVRTAPTIAGGSDALRGQLGPYFTALLARADQPGAVEQAFAAAQVLVRPGVAQTQAVLARELSAGSDAAADLFRQSLALDREVRAIDQTLALPSAGSQDPGTKPLDTAALAQLAARRAALAGEQTEVQARLSGFARYLAVSDQPTTLEDLRKTLRDDEAYYKLIEVDGADYAFWVQPHAARLLRVAATPADLEALVNRTRDSIVSHEGNQIITNPFDLVSARRLFVVLFGAVAPDLARVHHLIFEPDGAMLKLPPGVLVSDDAGLTAYAARQQRPDADAFDFSGVAWLGRDHMISTAVSTHAFVDVRALAASRAPRRYLGLGHNAPPPAVLPGAGDPCGWPRSTWMHPVSGAELTLAAIALGGPHNELRTDGAFTDSGLVAAGDLATFRVIQFATHGLVTAPHPGCAAEPALVTSFGSAPSQGLLTFREIFNLHLDADTVILSACDTAGAASIDATRAAGVSTGGNFALDGLVRAFVGAGARSVVASHWPVPDDYNATSRLMGGLFRAGTGTAVGEALRQSQARLMDDPLTSHPYYWAAFAVVGDAAKPITSP